jgi:hypothetical protein
MHTARDKPGQSHGAWQTDGQTQRGQDHPLQNQIWENCRIQTIIRPSNDLNLWMRFRIVFNVTLVITPGLVLSGCNANYGT